MNETKDTVYLRAFEIEDYKIINKWRHDDDMNNMLVGSSIYVSSEREKKWVEEIIHDDRTKIYFAICDKETDEMVGYTSVRKINWRNRSAYWGGMTIGKEHWNKGYAQAANALVLKYVFDELGLNRFYTDYLEEHKVSTRIFEKMRFTVEGVSRSEVYKGGRFHNVVNVSMLKEEYDSMTKK